MNGQLSEQPLAELIREISTKRISGRLQVQQDRVKAVIYFQDGLLIYAASNVRTLRLTEYLQKSKLISEKELGRFGQQHSDLALAAALSAEKLVTPEAAQQLQLKQVSDVLRVSLLWTEGTWDFDDRSHLREQVSFKIDTRTLVLEAGRRTPEQFAATRFPKRREMISAIGISLDANNLLPSEGFLLSRLDSPTALDDLVALSGLGELEALRLIYGLAVAGFVGREHWKTAFRDVVGQPKTAFEKPPDAELASARIPAPPSASPIVVDGDKLDAFLARISEATTHYEVLEVDTEAKPEEIKHAYYELARRYHPDRFRKNASTHLHARIESAFARITQAYETLMNDGRRSTYNSKLKARERAKNFARSAPKASVRAHSQPAGKTSGGTGPAEDVTRSNVQRAEDNFKEGFAALQQGQLNIAIGLLSSAARLVPNEGRYRAYYGRALGATENTRRLAEVELQAAIKLEPNNSQYRLMLAELFRDLGFSIRARSEAERVVAADPNNRKARKLLSSLI